MTVSLNPYLNFRGNAREAAEFYHSVFGGDLILNTFAELGGSSGPADADLIMHSQVTGANGLVLMCSDVPDHMSYAAGDHVFSVSLSGDDEPMLNGFWQKLSEGATIEQPLTAAPWGDTFGMLVDRFGVSWLVNISGAAA